MKLINNIIKKTPIIKQMIAEIDNNKEQVQTLNEEKGKLYTIIFNKERELEIINNYLNKKTLDFEENISNIYQEMEQQQKRLLDSLNKEIAEREEKIAFLNQKLEQQQKEMQDNLNKVITEEEEKIAFLNQKIEQQQREMHDNLNKIISENEEKIAAISKEIENQNYVIPKMIKEQNGHEIFDSASFWEEHYKKGGNSGAGSYNHLSEFKAKIVNNFIKNNNINTLIEIGCGDGNIISMLNVNNYVGVDVSPTIIEKNRKLFQHDMSKSFFTTEEREEYIYRRFDASLSMDVIFHLVEDDIFYAYMKDLFDLSERYVIIYSSNHEEYTAWKEFRHRNFTGYVQNNFPEWEIYKYIPNKYPYIIGNETGTSVSDFFIYRKKTYKRERKYL